MCIRDRFISYSKKQLAANAASLADLQEKLAAEGISMQTILVPMAAQVLTDKLLSLIHIFRCSKFKLAAAFPYLVRRVGTSQIVIEKSPEIICCCHQFLVVFSISISFSLGPNLVDNICHFLGLHYLHKSLFKI